MRVRGMELEWAFTLGRDLPLATGPGAAPPSKEAILAALDCATPVVEVVASHIQQAAEPSQDAGLLGVGTTTIADQGGHGLLACLSHLAQPLSAWEASFADAGVSVAVGPGGEVITGGPAAVMGSPLLAAQWLVASLQSVGSAARAYGEAAGVSTLPAGTVLTTGTMTGITPVAHGDSVTLNIAGETLQLRFELE